MAVIGHLVAMVPALHEHFARYEEVDEATYRDFEARVSLAPPLTEAEDELVELSKMYDDQYLTMIHRDDKAVQRSTQSINSSWERVPGTVRDSVSYVRASEGVQGRAGVANTCTTRPRPPRRCVPRCVPTLRP